MSILLTALFAALLVGFLGAILVAHRTGVGFRWGPAWCALLLAAVATAALEQVLAARVVSALAGSLFSFLLLWAAFDQVGVRAPGWLLPAGIVVGTARGALRAAGHWGAAEWISVGIELPVTLAAIAVLWRGGPKTVSPLARGLLTASLGLLAAGEAGDAYVGRFVGGAFPWALWLGACVPAAVLQMLATLEDAWVRGHQAERSLLRSEAHLREAQRLAHVGSWEWDLARGTLRYSDESYRILGLEPGSPVRVDDFVRAIVPEDRERMGRAVERAIASGDPIEIEYRIRRPSGEERILRGRGAVHRDREGRAARVTGVTQDVTERVRAEQERMRLELRLHEAQRLESLRLQAAGVAHDFQNLLTGVLGNLEMSLGRLHPRDPLREPLEDARLAAEHAAELTDQLLLQAGHAKLRLERVALDQLARDVARVVRGRADGTAVEVDPEPSSAAVLGDRAQLRQVMLNLLTNAVAACRRSGGRVRVRTGCSPVDPGALPHCVPPDAKPGRYAWIEVEDDGCGMDATTLRHVFDPFFTTRADGRGLGLAATLGIVKQHGGAIAVRSLPGRGSTFRILLPPCEDDAGGHSAHTTD